jgi:hypothetical protein
MAKRALVVGIGDYGASAHLPLLAADSDAEKLASAFRDQGWDVHLLNGKQADAAKPTRSNIYEALGITVDGGGLPQFGAGNIAGFGAGAASADDVVLFYYGGHGLTAQDGVDYLLPLGSDASSPREQLVNLLIVIQALQKSGAGSVIVFTDACRKTAVARGSDDANAPVWGRGVGASNDIRAVFDSQNVHSFVMKSASPGQASWDLPVESAGAFTFFLIEVLSLPAIMSDADGNRDGRITLKELEDYVQKNTESIVEAKLRQIQRPEVIADGTDWERGFNIASYDLPPPADPPTDNTPDPTQPPPDPTQPPPMAEGAPVQIVSTGAWTNPFRADLAIDSVPIGSLFCVPGQVSALPPMPLATGPHSLFATIILPGAAIPLSASCNFFVAGPVTFGFAAQLWPNGAMTIGVVPIPPLAVAPPRFF